MIILVIESIVLSFIIVLLKRGRFSNLLKFNKKPIISLSIIGIIHVILIASEKLDISLINNLIIDNLYFVKLSLYVLAIIILLLNIKLSTIPIAIIILGIVLNGSVVLFNKPIVEKSEYTNLSIQASSFENTDIKLSILLDNIKLPGKYIFKDYISIGDIVMAAGIFTYIQDVTSRKKIYRLFS